MPDKSDYDVGYGKPPKHTQFRKGQSGNPAGRPKGARNLKTDVQEILNETITVTENDRKRKLSTQQVLLKQLREKAVKGDIKALDRLVALAARHNDDELAKDLDAEIATEDQRILARFLARNQNKETGNE